MINVLCGLTFIIVRVEVEICIISCDSNNTVKRRPHYLSVNA